MIGKLLRAAVAMFVYACVGTVIAECILGAYFFRKWSLDRDRLVQMLAIAYGIDVVSARDTSRENLDADTPEQASFAQILDRRAMKSRNMELREQALRDGLEQLRFEQNELAEATKRYDQVKSAFDAQLAAVSEQARSSGIEDNRAKLESLKPAQAKELIVEMLQKNEMDAVVVLLRDMATSKAAKIIGEFKSPEEVAQIGEVLRRIREGKPQTDLAASAEKQLNGTNPN